MELWCGNGKNKFKVQIWPLTFWPKSTEVLLGSRSTYIRSIIIVCQMEEELLYRNHFFTDGQTDGQTDSYGETSMYLHKCIGGGTQTYFQCGEIVEKWPPWMSKFHGGSHFFTTCGSKFNVKIWTVSAFNVEKWPGESLLTLKNDPGSHYLMLHLL